jgi:TatD DNase family protein
VAPVLIDSHCHLDFDDLAPRLPAILAAMAEAGVVGGLCVSVKVESFPAVEALALEHRHLFASAGVHPDYEDVIEPSVEQIAAMADRPRVVAVGETGLDYFRLEGDLEWQRDRFRRHIRAAREVGKPLIVHTRSSAEDTLRILREEGAQAVGGVMHCFTESLEVALAAIDLGFMISFSGILTFRNAESLREVARIIPLESILVETDSPYLAPVPMRGKINEPAFVRHTAARLAEIRGQSFESIAQATTANALRLFRIDPADLAMPPRAPLTPEPA